MALHSPLCDSAAECRLMHVILMRSSFPTNCQPRIVCTCVLQAQQVQALIRDMLWLGGQGVSVH